jgi:hypothetical protein
MPAIRHCRHCWGDCAGDCLFPGAAGDAGLCIHRPHPRLPWRDRVRLLAAWSFWRRFLWGTHARPPGSRPGRGPASL